MKVYKCKCCGDGFSAREADRKRGWALYCSKSCKAIAQTRKTGRGKPIETYSNSDNDFSYHAEDPSWDAHKSFI